MTFKPFSTVGLGAVTCSMRSTLDLTERLFVESKDGKVSSWTSCLGLLVTKAPLPWKRAMMPSCSNCPMAQGDAADTVVGGKLGFGWKFIVNLPFLLGDPQNDVIGDLLIGRKGRSAV